MSNENGSATVEQMPDSAGDAESKRQRSSIAFPYMDLSEAVAIARAIHNNVGTGACSIAQLAPWVKQSPSSSGFRNRLTASRLFGLVDTSDTDAVRLTELGRMVMDAQREREGRAKAFLSVPLFGALHDKFKGSVVPPEAALEKEMVALGVAGTLKNVARRVFERSAEQSGFYEAGRDRLVMPGFTPGMEPKREEKPPKSGNGDGDGTGLDLDPLLIELLKKIPPTKDGWPAPQRLRWFKTFAMNVSQIYDEDDSPVEMEIKLEAAS